MIWQQWVLLAFLVNVLVQFAAHPKEGQRFTVVAAGVIWIVALMGVVVSI